MGSGPTDQASARWAPTSGSLLSTPIGLIVVALVSAALALGGVWGVNRWSQRADAPVDELMPFLTVDQNSDNAPVSDTAAAVANGDAINSDTAGFDPIEAGITDLVAQADSASAVVSEADPAPPTILIVHVSGAVIEPGIVQLAPPARVFEAVQAAGGATADAALDRVNLAASVFDGERVHVPAEGETVPEIVGIEARSEPPAAGAPAPLMVNLNSADVTELEELPGVGPATARSIVTTREQRGPFRSVDELLEVPGIGEVKLAELRAHVTVSVG